MSQISRQSLCTGIAALLCVASSASAQVVLRPCRPLKAVHADTSIDVSGERISVLYNPVEGSEPLFPLEMRKAGMSGMVRASFVVDTLGRVVRGSAQIVEETNTKFGTAVCNYFDRAKFLPVVVRDRKMNAHFVNARFAFPLRKG